MALSDNTKWFFTSFFNLTTLKINHSDFNLNIQLVILQNNQFTKNCFNKEVNYKYISINELEEVEEIDEITNKIIDDKIIDKTINVIDNEENSNYIIEL